MSVELEDPRRRLLIRMLAAGILGGTAAAPDLALAQLLGSAPAQLPAGKSVYRVAGEVTVDGRRATLDSAVGDGCHIKTGSNGEIVYAFGGSAYIARPMTDLVVEGVSFVRGIRLLAGRLLCAFPNGKPVNISTASATIGIRGTGVYLEADPELTYFCTCYGVADVAANGDPASRETILASQHDRPVYILGGEPPGRNIRNAPLINHTDQELMLIETLVGREPPFVFPMAEYSGPRRSY